MCSDTNLADAPKEIKVIPLGNVHSVKGDFVVDDESVKLIMQRFKERGINIVIDYEHQTLMDIQAPAGGWITELYPGKDAIMAKVAWTPKAEQYLKNKEYKYLSPVVLVRKYDNRAIELHSVALTNTPAIDGMFSINKNGIEEEETMDLKELAKLIGLPETATEDEVKEKLKEMAAANCTGKEPVEEPGKESGKEPGKEQCENVVANSTILGLLGLDAGAKTEDVLSKIMSLKSGRPNLEEELKALKANLENREADEAVNEAMKSGKITAAQQEWAKTYALKDKEGFKSFIAKAPVVVPNGKIKLEDAPRNESEELNLEICKNCGMSEEDIIKQLHRMLSDDR